MKFEQHLEEAAHNERFLADHDLVASEYLDWAVTVISYSALHYVDALLARSYGFHPRDHRERSHRIHHEPALRRHLRNDFEDLKNDGIEARYTDRVFTKEEVTRYILPLLDKIKRYVGQYVNLD